MTPYTSVRLRKSAVLGEIGALFAALFNGVVHRLPVTIAVVALGFAIGLVLGLIEFFVFDRRLRRWPFISFLLLEGRYLCFDDIPGLEVARSRPSVGVLDLNPDTLLGSIAVSRRWMPLQSLEKGNSSPAVPIGPFQETHGRVDLLRRTSSMKTCLVPT